ncbi:TldD/PmbA family protein [Iamia sp. SCSIO 61187]|uniref:TldD/PmbA family protein n=1 Tax=Iamia sp. SCSIO 61187 TaxID=2722752 RepID=UPI001C62EF64|nr:TldD/PmbA family protein [Iamia sp. SCSIO 61187]QYG93898.1 TldD/PmbA family protein [Iamia sp. SCSIO 61187]
MSGRAGSGDLTDIADRVVAMAGDGEQVEAVVGRSRHTEVRAYQSDVESLSSAETMGVGIRVVLGDRQGFAYAATFDEDVIAETLAEARDNAGFASPDPHVGLAAPDGVPVPELDLFRPSLLEVSTERKVELALELEAAVKGADPRISGVESAEFVDAMGEACVATTTGIRSESASTACYVAVSCLAEADGLTQTGFGFSVGRELDDLVLGDAADDAVMRATRLLGATKPASTRTTIVLDPYVTAQVIGIIGSTLSGEMVLKGRSPFAERLGEEVGSPLVTLVDDATNPLAYTASATDGEGLASRRTPLISEGVLRSFVHNAYSGRWAGTASTGNAVRGGFKSTPGVGCRALSLAPGEHPQDELLRQVGEGVLISSVIGMHSGVNAVSGDFSTGAEGLRITGGEQGAPLREFTIASTLQRMLRDVEAVGNDVDWLPMSAAGVSLVIRDVTISGT